MSDDCWREHRQWHQTEAGAFVTLTLLCLVASHHLVSRGTPRLYPFASFIVLPSNKLTDSMAQIVDDDDSLVCSQQVLLRINAANLPRHGILQALPDTYAVVSSVSIPNGEGSVTFDLSQTYVNNGTNGSNSHGQTKIEWGKTEMYVFI